ncbi:MAG: hypothetical protein HOG49_33520 [Candidatus Scalindua sp.]|jgi:hypothetical protein|nr:hypothetical protein [Candidatus Scalindua sp.]
MSKDTIKSRTLSAPVELGLQEMVYDYGNLTLREHAGGIFNTAKDQIKRGYRHTRLNPVDKNCKRLVIRVTVKVEEVEDL